jgi:hypothetical protein
MAQALAKAAVSFFGATGTAAKIIYATTYAATAFAVNKALISLERKGAKGAGGGLEISVTDPAAEGRVIYGRVRIGGIHVIPPVCSGNDGDILHSVLALCVHEVSSFESVYFDQDEITNGQITSVLGNANDGLVTGTKYANKAWIRRYGGQASQNVDYILNAAFTSSWPSTARGRGIAYVAASFKYGNGKTYSGAPVVTVVVNGKACYDPRLDTSPGANPTNASYIAWTENPALIWADFKMNAVYGQKLASTKIDWDTVVDAADVCDELVDIPGGSTQPRYTFNGVLFTGGDTIDNEKDIVDAMMGKMAYTDGKYRIFAGAWRAPEYDIEKEDWVSIGAIRTTAPRGDDRFNGVVVYHVDPDRNWQRVEGFRRYSDTYKSADGGERVWVEMEQPHCTDKYEVERKGEFLLRQSRNGITLSGTLPPRFQKLRTWDNVALYFDEMGWTAKTFTVASCALAEDGSVNVVLVEEQSSDWTDLTTGEYGATSVSPFPTTNQTTPSEPSTFTVTPLLGVIQYDFGEPVVRPAGMRYQILRSPGTLATAGSFSVIWEGDVTQIVLPGDPRTLQWYHGRTIASSYVSPLQPNTFGIASAPWIAPEAVPGNRGFPDGELYFASTSYWTSRGLQSYMSYTLVTSGGMTDQRGRLILSVASGGGSVGGTTVVDHQVMPTRFDINSRTSFYGVPMMAGQSGIAYITARRVSSYVPVADWYGIALKVSSPKHAPAEGVVFGALALTQSVAFSNSGQWVTYIQTFTMPNSIYDHFKSVIRFRPSQSSYDQQQTFEVAAMQVSVL